MAVVVVEGGSSGESVNYKENKRSRCNRYSTGEKEGGRERMEERLAADTYSNRSSKKKRKSP